MISRIRGLLADPSASSAFSMREVAAVLCQLSAIQSALAVKLATGDRRQSATESYEDRLLTATEAAAKLGVSKDWLYRKAGKLPFTVRLGHRRLRFSAAGIERFIRQRQGRS